MLTLRINGESRQLNAVACVADLVVALGLSGKRVALERMARSCRAANTRKWGWRTATSSKS